MWSYQRAYFTHAKCTKYETCAKLHRFHILYILRECTYLDTDLVYISFNISRADWYWLWHNGLKDASYTPIPHKPWVARIATNWFFSYSGGDSWGYIIFFSPIVMFYESVPIQIRCRYEYSGESAQFGWNRARIHYDSQNNIRTCCTKAKESITNQLRICPMQHELDTN